MFFGSQILIFYAVGLQIRQNISLVVSKQQKIPTSGITNKAIVPAHADGEHYPCGSQATICSNKTQ